PAEPAPEPTAPSQAPKPTPRRKPKPTSETKPSAADEQPKRPPVDKLADTIEEHNFVGSFPAMTDDVTAAGPVETTAVGGYSIVDEVDRQDRRSRMVVPVVLAVVAVLIGGLAAWFGVEWTNTSSTSAASNTALSDVGTTSEVNGQISNAVNQTFSFD